MGYERRHLRGTGREIVEGIDSRKNVVNQSFTAFCGRWPNSWFVCKLIEAGFESYTVDFRRSTATYYLPFGDSIELTTQADHCPVEASFNTNALQAAIRDAQTLAPGCT